MRKLSGREKLLLAVLAIPIVLYFAMREEGFGFGGAAEERRPLAAPVGEPPLVRMDLLARQVADYDPRGRNLFQYYVPPRRPAVRKPPPAPPPVVRDRPPPPPPKKTKRTPREPRPPTPDFKYLGFLGPKDGKIAVFDGGEELMLAQIGDVVESQFRVVSFGYETVTLGFVEERFKDKPTELKMTTK